MARRYLTNLMVRSYNGHYLGLSIRRREFDSPTHRQYNAVMERGRGHVLRILDSRSGSSPLAAPSILLGYSVTVSTTVFEIVSLGSSPDTPAKFMQFMFGVIFLNMNKNRNVLRQVYLREMLR